MRKCAKSGSLNTFLLVVCFNLRAEKLTPRAQNGPWQNGRGKSCPRHQPEGRNNQMKLPASKSEQVALSSAFKVQRYALAASIILGPVSVALFVYSWPAGLLRQAIQASAQAGPLGNMVHFIGGVAASFF